MNNNDFNSILKQAQKNSSIDLSKLKQAGEQGKLDDFINNNLSAQASSQLKKILNDKQATEKLLSTPQAKELMKKFMEGK